jgi:hypothetical protein
MAYLQFGIDTMPNVLNTYADDDKLMIAVRAAFFLQITFTYPAIHPSVVASWSSIIFKINDATSLVGWRRATILCVSNIIPILIGMFLPDIQAVLEIGGSIGGNIGCFAFPAMLWVIHSCEPKSHWTNVLAILFAIFGWVTAILSTYYGVRDAIEHAT